MNKIKAIIADDEKNIRDFITANLKQLWTQLDICGEAADGETALAMIRDLKPDIAFLDIRMPALSGLHVAEKMAGSCHFVFITAYDHYAVKAFENEAMDYIVKPISESRLSKTVARLKKRLIQAPADAKDTISLLRQVHQKENASAKHSLAWVKVQCKDGLRIIDVDSIYYFTKQDPYTAVVTRDETFLISKPIKVLITELDTRSFWQIHRSTIINVKHIKSVSRSLTGRGLIHLNNLPETLTVSRNFLYLFKHM